MTSQHRLILPGEIPEQAGGDDGQYVDDATTVEGLAH
jgi:hypothetical protein